MLFFLRTIKYISIAVLLMLMLVLSSIYIAINSNTFQNWITGKLSTYLSAQFKTKITIGHINYIPLQTFRLENVLFGDHKNDTLFYAGKIDFNLVGIDLDSTRFKLNNVKVDEGYCLIKFYEDESFNIDVLFNILDPNDTLPSTGPPFTLYFDKVKLTNSRFRFVNETDTSKWKYFAANDEYFYNINATASNFYIIRDSLHFKVSHLDLMEKGGFKASHIQSVVTIAPNCMLFDSLELKTPYTNAKGGFQMYYDSWSSFSNFYDEVKMKVELGQSVVDLRDVTFFASPFEQMPYKLRVKGKGKGTVSNLDLSNLDIQFGNNGIFKGKAKLIGLPAIDNTFIDAQVKQVSVTRKDIEYLAQKSIGNDLDVLGVMKFTGKYTGFYKDFVAFGSLHTAIGSVETDLNMKLSDAMKDYQYSGNLVVSDFDLGQLVKNNMLGKFSVHTKIEGKGLAFEDIVAHADADFDYFEFKNYRYHNIEWKGGLANKNITTNFHIDDPNIHFSFKGNIDLATDATNYNFTAKVTKANIEPLGFDTADLTVSADAKINFTWKDIDKNNGLIQLNGLKILRNEELYEINAIELNSVVNAGTRTLEFNTDNIHAKLKGNFNLSEFESLSKLVLNHLLPNYFQMPHTVPSVSHQFDFNIQAKSLYPFNTLYFPHIEASNLDASGTFNQKQMVWNFDLKLDQFSYNSINLRRINLNHNSNSNATVKLDIKRILVKDSLYARSVNIQSTIANNRAKVYIHTGDTNVVVNTNCDLDLLFSPDLITGQFKQGIVKIKESKIAIDSLGFIQYSPEGFTFNQFKFIRENNQFLDVNGLYSVADKHNLHFNLENIKLDILNDFIPSMDILTNGVINGFASLQNKDNHNVLSTNAELTHLSLDRDTIGDFKFVSNYAEQQNRLMAYMKSVKGKFKNMEVGGYYDFSSKDDALNFSIQFDESDISSLQAFVKDYIKLYTGSIRANGQLSGSLAKPEFSSTIDLMGVTLRVEYLKTLYSFSTSIKINEQNITIAPTEIKDVNEHTAIAKGIISHKNFSKFNTNLSLTNLTNFQLLNTKSKDNDLFYGVAYADGGLTLTGPIDDLLFDAEFTVKKESVVNIPLANSYGDNEDGLIRFVNKDSTRVFSSYKKSGSLTGFSIKCLLHATKDAELNIVMDEQQNDRIRGRGEGDVLIELTNSGQFNMYGEVEVNEGDYNFTAMNLFTKKFTLKPGGKINWTGDPFEGQMNITGVYNVRTSVADIIASATSDERERLKQQRVPVECLLYVKGSLLNPDIKFDLNVNDVNGTLTGSTVSELQNSLRIWRNENELMTQQVVSLMLFGRFAPTNIQNSSNNTAISAGVSNTLSGFVSSQATGLIQRIIPGFDLNIDYHTGTESMRSRQIVSGTKRMFDNRLEIQASFDPINTYQNFLTQYNLSKDGRLKAKAFSRAQLDPIYNRNINTNGIGLYYRKEFDKLSEIFSFK